MAEDAKLPAAPAGGAVPVGEAAASNDKLDITRPFIGPLQINDDSVLAARGGGLELYEEVLRDDQVYSSFQQRRLAVTSREWQIDAGGTDKASEMAADFFREMMFADSLRFDDRAGKMHFGVFYGYASAELMYGRDGRHVTIDQIKVRKARRFRFDKDGGLRLLTRENMVTGELMPGRKFWTLAMGADNDDAPYGLGLAHWCYWPTFFKRNDIRLWLIFLDKFGAPTPVGKFPPNTSPGDINKLLQAAKAMATSSAVAIPSSMVIDLVQSSRSGAGEYGVAYDKFDAAIARVILSQTATSIATPGKLGNQDDQLKVRDEVAKGDSDLICASFNNGPVRWLTEWNFPGARPPRLYRNFEEPEDLAKTADTDTKVFNLGFEPSESYVQEKYGAHWTKRAPVPGLFLQPPMNGAEKPPAVAFAELAQRDGIDAMVDQMLKAGNVMDAPVAELRLAFAQANGFDDLKTRLAALKAKGLNMDALGNALAGSGFQLLGGAILGDLISGQAGTIGEVIGK
jgi:phage gp29-like protein